MMRQYFLLLLVLTDVFTDGLHVFSDRRRYRTNYRDDLMVESPVVLDAPGSNSSNVHKFYTKSPVTEMIDGKIFEPPKRASPNVKRTDDLPPVEERHPYTEFLLMKPSATRSEKSPLDYGYPESFKFAEELNEMPKNHKPEWATLDSESISNSDTPSVISTTEEGDDPFKMFGSVKPLEINKLLSLKPVVISVTDNVADDLPNSTEDSHEFQVTKHPPPERPTKRPPKLKSNPQKLSDEQLQSVTTAQTGFKSPSFPASDNDLESEYTAVKYSTLLAKTTSTLTANRPHVVTLIRHIIPLTTPTTPPTSTTTTTNASTTSTSTTVTPNLNWAYPDSDATTTINEQIEQETTSRSVSKDKQSTLISLTKSATQNTNTMSPEMKSMLIALGIVKPEEGSMSPAATTTTAATAAITTRHHLFNVFGQHNSMSPTVDPQSYVSFKKLPIDEGRHDVISDDMNDLLASFGLLPKRNGAPTFSDSALTRISRDHKFKDWNSTQTGETDELLLMPENLQNTLGNLGLLKPLALNYQPHKTAHVFQPSMHLAKLGDEQKVKKINEAIENIRKLSKSREVRNLTLEEIEKQLENVTSFLQDENLKTDNWDTVISNATATKIVETVAKIPFGVPEDDTDDFVVHYSPDESAVSVVNFTSTEDESILSLSNSTEHEPVSSPSESTKHKPVPSSSESTSSESNIVMDPPNPLSTEELDLLMEIDKNEVKRQQPNNSTSTTSSATTELGTTADDNNLNTTTTTTVTTTTTPTTTTTTTTMASTSRTESVTQPESNNAAVSDLAESFGGGLTIGPTDDMSTQRPNGLYFYLDWNTFLNVGDSDRNPVRIRFAPRAGNARNFLPITVP